MLLTNTTGFKPCSEKRVELQCDSCGKVTDTTFANYNHAQKKRGFTGETFCKKCACVKTGLKSRGKRTPWNKGKKFPHLSKENSRTWNGGKYLAHDGYMMLHVGGDRGVSNWGQYRKEHKVVMENKIGRQLKKQEVVHHIDGNKINNNENNLWLANHRGHRKAHVSLQQIGYNLFVQGLIGFDTEKGTYFWRGEDAARFDGPCS